jgi:hypothetical protein
MAERRVSGAPAKPPEQSAYGIGGKPPIGVRENNARRAITRLGYALRKSRRRDPQSPDFGLYCILDPVRNAYVAGGSPWSHSMTLDDVEAWLER